MRKNIFKIFGVNLLLWLTPFSYANTITLEPGSLLESMHTGKVTITDNTFNSERGSEIEIKPVQYIIVMEGMYRKSYELLSEDKLGLCDDGSEADYIEVTSEGALFIYQMRENSVSNKQYIYLCNDLFYIVEGMPDL